MTVGKASTLESGTNLHRVLVSIVMLASLAVLVLIYANIDRGFDLTDESYYLLLIDRPEAYGLAASTFGYFLSPIFHLLGSDPAALRRFGLVAPALAAALISFLVLKPAGADRYSRPGAAAVTLSVAASVITYYCWWLPTPSYNWLPLPAAFLLLSGLVLARTDQRFWLSVLLVAAAGVLAFAGKPSTAGGFALAYGLGILIQRGISAFTLRHIAFSALCCSLIFLGAFLTIMDASLALSQARAYIAFFGVGPAIGGLFKGAVGPWGYYVTMALAVATYWVWPRIGRVLGVVAIISTYCVFQSLRSMPYHSAQGMIVMSASLAVVANSFAWAPKRPDGRMVLIVSLGHLLPWLIAFGTGNPLYRQVGFYAALPLTAAIVTAGLCFGLRDWRTFVAALVAPLFAATALYFANMQPYRLQPGFHQKVFPVEVAGGALRVDGPTRDFITSLRESAAAAGYVPGTPILDASGDTPGIALLLGGRAPYFPWMISGYVFSEPLASAIVGQLTPQQRQEAWLVRNDAPRPFGLDFMASLGFDLEKDYKVVAAPIHPLYGEQVRLYAPAGTSAP